MQVTVTKLGCSDTVTIIAEPSIVNAFHNSELVLEPETVRDAFEEQIEKVSEFLDKIKSVGRQELSREISKRVLRGLSDGKVGLYSKFHDNALVGLLNTLDLRLTVSVPSSVYELGYRDTETIRLAYMWVASVLSEALLTIWQVHDVLGCREIRSPNQR